jgi:FkbM family methyltransferase
VIHSLSLRSYFFYKRHFEDPFARLTSARPELFTRGHLLDVGANIGYTAVVFASAIRPGDKVFAFEPEIENFKRLTENLGRFGVANRVVAHAVAVGADDGMVDIWLNQNHPGDHRTVTNAFRERIGQDNSIRTVPMVSIDSFVDSNQISRQIGFIKIDVQGYETQVCYGMQRTLESNPRATVAVEYAPSSMAELGIAASTLVDFFVQRSFNVYELLRNGKLKLLTSGQVKVGADEWINLLCSREQL